MTSPDISVAGSLSGIYLALVEAGPTGISCDETMMIAIKAGSAQYDSRMVGWRISRLRDKLKAEGWTIRATSRGGVSGRYILEPIGGAPIVETPLAPAAQLGITPVERRVYGGAFTSTSAGMAVSVARVSFIDGARP